MSPSMSVKDRCDMTVHKPRSFPDMLDQSSVAPVTSPRLGEVCGAASAHDVDPIVKARFSGAMNEIARLMGRHAARVAFNSPDSAAARNIVTAIIAAAALAYLLETLAWQP